MNFKIWIYKINIGYARVSTIEQVKTGYSIEFQQERIKEQFEKINIENYRIFVDDGVSGRTLNRLKIKMIIQMIQSNKVNSVVVYKLDRLSRNITDLINVCTDNNVNFISITEQIDLSTALGRMFIYIICLLG